MSSLAQRPDGRWRARYRDAEGREHARHFAEKRDAEDWLAQVRVDMLTGRYIDPRAGAVTVEAYARQWQALQLGREGTARILDNALRLHIIPRLGPRRLNSVRTSDVRSLVKALDAVLAPGSVRNIYGVLARLFSDAVDDRLIAESPCTRKVKLPTDDDREVAVPSVDEVLALAEAIAPIFRSAVVMLAGSGLRIGELLAVQPGDVNFLKREVRVERQRLQSGEIAPVKTPKSRRTVPLGSVVVDELAAHLATYGRGEWLFQTWQGEPLLYRTWKRAWHTACRSAGVAFSTHDLRHFFASALIGNGASVKQVQTVLGHSSAVITLRTYAHLWPGDDDRTRSAADAVLAPLRTGCGPEGVMLNERAGQSG